MTVRDTAADGVLTVVLDGRTTHPLDVATIDGLRAAWRTLAERDDLRAAVLGGEGLHAFSTGGDADDLLPRLRAGGDAADELLEASAEALRHLGPPPKPVVAAVEGLCIGGGLELALACDLIVAGRGAVMWLPEARLGLVPAAGIARLSARLPAARVLRLALLGEQIDASAARDWGLVAEVVPRGTALDRAHELARHLAALPGETGSRIVELVRRPDAAAVEPQLIRRELERQFAQARS